VKIISDYLSVFLYINITLFCILKYLNKEESKVIFMQEFEISLFQFSNSMFTDKRQFSFKEHFKTFCEAFVVEFYIKLKLIYYV
jgi:hypothetical protein